MTANKCTRALHAEDEVCLPVPVGEVFEFIFGEWLAPSNRIALIRLLLVLLANGVLHVFFGQSADDVLVRCCI